LQRFIVARETFGCGVYRGLGPLDLFVAHLLNDIARLGLEFRASFGEHLVGLSFGYVLAVNSALNGFIAGGLRRLWRGQRIERGRVYR
jgi:hypothetical protein